MLPIHGPQLGTRFPFCQPLNSPINLSLKQFFSPGWVGHLVRGTCQLGIQTFWVTLWYQYLRILSSESLQYNSMYCIPITSLSPDGPKDWQRSTVYWHPCKAPFGTDSGTVSKRKGIKDFSLPSCSSSQCCDVLSFFPLMQVPGKILPRRGLCLTLRLTKPWTVPGILNIRRSHYT